MFEKILQWNLKWPFVGFVVAILVALLGVGRGLDLPIKLSLADLLTESRDSVLDLQAVSKEVGGVGYLIVLLGPTEKPESLLPKVAETLKKNPDIRYTFHEREEYSLRHKALYLMSEREFETLLDSAKILLRGGKKGVIDLGLESEEDQKRNREKAKARIRKLQGGDKPRYFLSEDKKYAMLLAKPIFDSEDLGLSRKLVDKVRSDLQAALPENTPFELVGRYVDKVNDTKQIERDIQFTGWISVLGVAFVLIVGLGAFRATAMTIFCVSIAMAWTLGFAQVAVGQINILTGFLLSILGGLGVEYGVHLIRRYYQERKDGKTHLDSLQESYLVTGRALGSAAITSSAAFFILSFSDFRGFSELGKIAGAGILSIYFVYLLCFPLMGRFLREKPRFGRMLEWFGFYPFTKKWRWALVPFILLCVWGFTRAEFEYNFKRMHDLSKETQARNQFVNDLFGRSFTPAALLASNASQARELERWLQDAERKPYVQDAISLHRLIPDDMADRAIEIGKLNARLSRLSDEEIKEKIGADPADIRAMLDSPPYGRNDLPPQLRDAFGKSGNIVLAYPKLDLDQAENLRSFSQVLVDARKNFSGVKVGSDVRIFTEILDHITKDGLIILLIFMAGAFFMFGIDFRSWFDAIDLELQLLGGIFLLVALMGLFDVRFSILNIAMVPAVLAAGIDMGVHLRHREREGYGALPAARFVAQAVQVSALTTMIGFGSLFFAEAGMLKGIAWISVLGQLSMYLLCMVIWPVLRGERKRRDQD